MQSSPAARPNSDLLDNPIVLTVARYAFSLIRLMVGEKLDERVVPFPDGGFVSIAEHLAPQFYDYDTSIDELDAWIEGNRLGLQRFLASEWNGLTENDKQIMLNNHEARTTALKNWYKDHDKSGMPAHWEDHTICAGAAIVADLADNMVELSTRNIDAALSHPNHEVALCAAQYRCLTEPQMWYLEQRLLPEEFARAQRSQQEVEHVLA